MAKRFPLLPKRDQTIMVENQIMTPEKMVQILKTSFQYGYYTASPDADPIIVHQKCDESMSEIADELLRDFYPQNYVH
jgi:hypothetical protein